MNNKRGSVSVVVFVFLVFLLTMVTLVAFLFDLSGNNQKLPSGETIRGCLLKEQQMEFSIWFAGEQTIESLKKEGIFFNKDPKESAKRQIFKENFVNNLSKYFPTKPFDEEGDLSNFDSEEIMRQFLEDFNKKSIYSVNYVGSNLILEGVVPTAHRYFCLDKGSANVEYTPSIRVIWDLS